MDNNEILDFLKDYKELFQDKPENLDWTEIYNLASARFEVKNYGKFTEFWLNRGVHPEKYLTELPGNFCRGSTIKEFTIPDSVTKICKGAFYECASLENVVIGNNVTSIDIYAFYGCESLTNIVIPGSVTSIDYKAFAICGDNLVIDYQGTKEDWKKIYNPKNFQNTHFTANCTDGVVKKLR